MDKAINADSENAPKQLRAILLTENQQWKLPERRVARYLKRHLKSRKNPLADQIEADMDEETVYTLTNSVIDARAEEDAAMRLTSSEVRAVKVVSANGGEAYVDEEAAAQSATQKQSKALFCDGLQCVIS